MTIAALEFGKTLRPSTVELINKMKVTLYTPLASPDTDPSTPTK